MIILSRAFRVAGGPSVLPPGTPKDRVAVVQEAFRKTYKDPEFLREYKSSPATRRHLSSPRTMKGDQRNPREPEIVELYKKIAGAGPLPAR